jgi:radical SAM protein (TIGR01212 family)
LEALVHSAETWKNAYWYSLNDHLSGVFGERVYKVTVSAGFTCPTRDGTKGTAGCAFCDERGSASYNSFEQASLAIQAQLSKSIPFVRERFRAHKFLAYFQSYTNTYGNLPYLQEVYDCAVNYPDVVGLAVGTRPDCVPNEVLALLNRYGQSRYVSLELGLQSFRDDTLLFYERGHSVAEGIDAVQRALRYPNLKVSAHLMFGAPGETAEDAINAARMINSLGVHGVKIHQLMVLKDTTLASRYAETSWPLYTLDEYNVIAASFLEHLDPRIHVERTHALSSHPAELVGPAWSAERYLPQNSLRRWMGVNGLRQGRLFTPAS